MKSFEARHYLLKASVLWDRVENRESYPYSLPVLRGLEEIVFHPKVTFFVGENGAGKSTLVEALAIAWGFNPEGGTKNFNFRTAEAHSSLHSNLRLTRGTKRARDGFFLRAESFFNVITTIDRLDEEPGAGPPIKDSYGGVSLHTRSHGESFFDLLEHRFGGHGLYILDEPEAALSPSRQLTMLVRMHDLIAQDSQFIIATHSPILMAYPDALIYQISSRGLERVAYEDTEHYQVTRAFLNRPGQMLEQLLK
ncbi:AAA family ATPase [Aestuariivirga sp.]|uniref:AAA family ATPase n=1 Tax=Aestuariivirga sp. TaxID=2650926 RepID=UPI0039E55F85